ncbi:glycosyltransferase [Edwardsiella tarda]|uniref:glycosyltransferase n=1 Tax=Edwardsiella tarda TaxID=636 RepID=UPI0034DCD2AD
MKKIDRNAIVFIIHQFQVGGVESVFINLSKIATSRKIYLLIAYDSINVDLLNKIKNVEVIMMGCKCSSLFSLAKAIFQIKKKVYFGNAHIINFSDTLSTLIIQAALNGRLNSSWVHCNPNALLRSRSFLIYKYLLSKNDNIICLCETQKKLLSEIIPCASDKIKVIYNYVNENEILALSDEMLLAPSRYIIMVSRFDSRTKDFKTLIDAYAKLSQDVQNKIKLVLLGDGPDKNDIENYANSTDAKGNVIFPGRDLNPFKWIRNADFLVHSSLSEGFSLVILEAMALGKAIISSDCDCGPADILSKGKYGLLFKVGDSVSLNEYIVKLISDNMLCSYFGALSLERFSSIQKSSSIRIKEFLE